MDANVSVHKENEPLGTRSEVKNIGSIRSVAHAIQYEINRQVEILEKGGTIANETRSWDAQNRQTVPMRDKEEKQVRHIGFSMSVLYFEVVCLDFGCSYASVLELEI